jgi:hypothetical protein
MNEDMYTSEERTKPVTPQTKDSKNNHWGLVIILVTAIFIATTLVMALINSKNNATEQNEPEVADVAPPTALPLEGRQAILDSLAESSASSESVDPEVRQAALDELVSASGEVEVSIEDRAAILDQLSAQNE